MVIIDRKVAGAAVATLSQTGMTPTVPGVGGTITVDDASGYPSTGKFEIVIDRGLTNEESVMISSRSGTTFTIGQRGYDGTVASTHTAGQASVELDLSATLVQLLIDHVDDIETAPHSSKLPVGTIAGHDVTARHAYGAAYGTPGTPVSLTPDIAGAPGTGARPAREDHVHNVPAAIVVSVGTTNQEGSAATFARSDHLHDISAGAIDNSAIFAADVVNAAAIADGAIDASAKLANAIVTLAKFASEAGTDYDPNFAGHNVTLGTGGVQWGRHFKLGRLVVVFAGFGLGSGTGNVSGEIGWELPFTSIDITPAHATIAHTGFITAALASDASPSQRYSGLGLIVTADGLARSYATAGASAVWDANTPFDWTNGDNFAALAVYEATA